MEQGTGERGSSSSRQSCSYQHAGLCWVTLLLCSCSLAFRQYTDYPDPIGELWKSVLRVGLSFDRSVANCRLSTVARCISTHIRVASAWLSSTQHISSPKPCSAFSASHWYADPTFPASLDRQAPIWSQMKCLCCQLCMNPAHEGVSVRV